MPSAGRATQSQRSQELRKFFAPSKGTIAPNTGLNAYIEEDGALISLAESVAWRLGARRVSISLIDGDTQYFLAGAELDGKNVEERGDWFGRSDVPLRESPCQYPAAAFDSTSEYSCVVVEDLLMDERYRQLPVVNGSLAAYRFFADAPIVTNRGVMIGSFFLLDSNPRPEGLTREQREVMCTAAARVMKHLEMHREAAERKRVTLMSHGLARFLERKSGKGNEDETHQRRRVEALSDAVDVPNEKASSLVDLEETGTSAAEESQDTVRRTFESAASLLRESLEIESGGVMFLDTAVSFSEAGITDAYSDLNTSIGKSMEAADGRDDSAFFRHNQELSQDASSSNTDPYSGQMRNSEKRNPAAEVMASSTSAEHQPADPTKGALDSKTLQTLLNMYPEGNVWYFDEEQNFSSLEQVEQYEMREKSGQSSPRQLEVNRRVPEEIAEATLLRQIFEKARQIIFLPMWDAATKRWYAGCLVWSHSAVPVFTADSEIAYLAAFTNSITVEVSRLDAVRADQAKADFISSISHEFRSPLHGILASAEFLRELTNDETQSELISTVQNCGRTLLETINHVLDFSKINSFQKTRSGGRQGGCLPNELYTVTNIAVLCEEVVEGMIAAESFDDISSSGALNIAPGSVLQAVKASEKPVEVVLDIQQQDWVFHTQPGALRRIIMNIFGNAQKYTDKGFIQIILRAEDAAQARARGVKGMRSGKSAIRLTVKDTGRGISNEYLQQKLYTPFAQDDTFAPGVGLGLSIVRNIVEQLEGVIAVRSVKGKGTEVEICIPVEKADQSHTGRTPESRIENPQDANSAIEALEKIAIKPKVAIQRPPNLREDPNNGQNMVLDCVEKYMSSWYGFAISKFTDWGSIPEADLVVALEAYEPSITSTLPRLGDQQVPTLLLSGGLPSKAHKRYPARMAVSRVTRPIGPYRLARHVLSVTQLNKASSVSDIVEPVLFTTGVQQENQRPEEQPKDNSTISDLQQPAAKEPEGDLKQRASSLDVRINDATLPFKDATLEPKSKGGLRILAVDDNEVNLQLLQRFLSKRKADIVDVGRDGFEAVAAVQKAVKPYDVVFMDISMPGMDGFEATRKIRQYESEQAASENLYKEPHPRTYVVALTGLGANRDREEAAKCGFDDYMTKPIPFREVGKLLKERSSN